MVEPSQQYYVLVFGFVSLFNLIAVSAVLMSFLKSRRDYLRVACFAGLCEIVRQGVEFTLVLNPESSTLYLLATVLQFGSTLLLVASLLLIFERVTAFYYWLFAILGSGLIVSIVAISMLQAEPTTREAYIYYLPTILLTVLLCWRAVRTGPGLAASKILLGASSAVILAIRLSLPAIDSDVLFGALYYIEYFCFIIMLAAIILFEVEFANRQIRTLLDERTRSEQDLQFIVDNSLDVILITDNVGLLQSWSSKAQSIFGYVPDQAVGKIHMDDLFANNYWGRDIGQAERFSSEMENVDGRRFPVEVRMREVNDAGSQYHVFVVNVLEAKLGD